MDQDLAETELERILRKLGPYPGAPTAKPHDNVTMLDIYKALREAMSIGYETGAARYRQAAIRAFNKYLEQGV